MARKVDLRLAWFRRYPHPPARGLVGRLLLLLSVLTTTSPLAAPVAEAAAGCDFAQMYGPYGALVGTATSDVILGITSCIPDSTNTNFLGLSIDHRPQINWGDGSGWQTSGIQATDCDAGLYCALHSSGHSYATPGSYTVQVKYYQLADWHTSPGVTIHVYRVPPHTAIDPANWMRVLQDELKDVKLDALTIPGTHDSGAAGFSSQSIIAPDFPSTWSAVDNWLISALQSASNCPSVVVALCQAGVAGLADFVDLFSASLGNIQAGQSLSTEVAFLSSYVPAQSNAQDGTITNQLTDGIRYLDLRLCPPAGTVTQVTLCHGLYSTTTFQQALTQIHDFVVAHPKEIVIVSLQAGSAMSQQLQADLVSQTRAAFSDNPADTCDNPTTCRLVPKSFTPEATLGSIWATHGQVILVTDDKSLGSMYGIDGNQLNPVMWSKKAAVDSEWIQLDSPLKYLNEAMHDLQCRCAGSSQAQSAMFYNLGTDMSPSDNWVASTMGQRFVQNGHGSTFGAVLVSWILNLRNQSDQVVDPAASSGNVLQSRAQMSNALVLNGVYDAVQANPGLVSNANIINTDWYDQSRLVDIAIALNLGRFPAVSLFGDANYAASSVVTTTSMPDLSATALGNAQASSLIVGNGMILSAYSAPKYLGKCQTFTAGFTPDLAKTRIGNDTISSLKLGESCPADFVPAPVTLCANVNSVPPCLTLATDVPKFSATSLGNDSLQSVTVPSIDNIALFKDENYQGMCVTFDGGVYNDLRVDGLSQRVSSMLVSRGCPVSDDDNGVALYDGINFTGASALATSNVPDLGALGLNDRVSSLAISRGLVVSLYSDANYQGVCAAFSANNADLRASSFPNDAASSLRIGTTSACHS